MFNFNLVNKGLMDSNLSDFAFRILYYVANTTSLKNVTEIETYIPFFVEKFGWEETKVKNTLKELVKAGYIIKTMGKNKGNKKPIILKLGVSSDTQSSKVGSQERPQFQSGVADMQKVGSPGRLLYNSTEDNNTRIEEKPMKVSRNEITKRNEYITSTYHTLESKLNYFYTVKTNYLFNALNNELEQIFTDANEHKEWFTDAQWEKLCRYADRWVKISDAKRDYFNNVKQENVEDDEQEQSQYACETSDFLPDFLAESV